MRYQRLAIYQRLSMGFHVSSYIIFFFLPLTFAGLAEVSARPDHLVFHSGVARNDRGDFVTNGGRVLIGVVLDSDLKRAAALATDACSTIQFDGSQHRRDIAQKAFKQ
uniref:Glycinamide ribonucleotide synthetase n=1 Tax=Anopheles darlingi TaxID=43151 RepID=A0A2M4DPA0_ANODA